MAGGSRFGDVAFAMERGLRRVVRFVLPSARYIAGVSRGEERKQGLRDTSPETGKPLISRRIRVSRKMLPMERPREITNRASRQVLRVWQEIARAQAMLALSDSKLAAAASVSPSTIRRIRAGDPAIQLDTLCAVAGAVGVDLVLSGYPGHQPSLRDTGQLTIAERLRTTTNMVWRPAFEVPVGEHGRRIDVVFFGAEEIIAAEIERRLVDFQLQYGSAGIKREALASAHARPVRLVLTIEDTRHNRRVAAEHGPLIRQALPAGSRDVLAALRSGQTLGRDGILWIRPRAART